MPLFSAAISSYRGSFSVVFVVQLVCVAVILLLLIFSKGQKIDDKKIEEKKMTKQVSMFYIAIVLTILVSIFSSLVNIYFL